MYSVKHLVYLTSLADERSFSKAAHVCNVTQSTLSLGIQELERQMGLTLFERSRKNIIPTPAGKKAIIHAREILQKQVEFTSDMQSMTNPNAGPLRVGGIPTIAPYFLPSILPKIEDSFPQANLQIAEDTTDVILDKIRIGTMDLGILALPIDTGDLETKILFEENFLIAAHDSHSYEKTTTMEALNEKDILLLRDGHCLKDHILSACHLPPEKQNKFFEAESLQTLLAMVNQDYGITLIPEMAVKSGVATSYKSIQIIPFHGEIPKRQIGLVWRRTDVRRRGYLNLDF